MLYTVFNVTKSKVSFTSAIVSLAGDLTVNRAMTVDAPISTVWKMVGCFNQLDVWHPAVVASELSDGNGREAGTIRTLALSNNRTRTEKLLAFSQKTKSYTYSIVDSSLPVSNFISTLALSDEGNNTTAILWSAIFDAKGTYKNAAIKAVTTFFDAGLLNLDKHFNC